MPQELLYVYCIYSGPLIDWKKELLCPFTIFIINGFQVVVKNVSSEDYSEAYFKNKVSDLPWLDKQVREHIAVISNFMQIGTVIPFKFGTIYHSVSNLTLFLHQYSNSLQDQLLHLENKEEWSVKMYGDIPIMSKKIDQLSMEAAKIENQIQSSTPGKAFLLKKKKQLFVEEEIESICIKKSEFILDLLKLESFAFNLNVLQTKEITGRVDEMILNACFLVKRNDLQRFQKVIAQYQDSILSDGFKMETTGPWPPFSFISIKENKNAS